MRTESLAMNITEIRIKLVHDLRDKLRGFASITLDDALVIRDLKIIEGGKGLFVAMPSRKLHDRCASCACKNPLRARYCNDCGRRLREQRGDLDDRGRVRLYADIAHPIHQEGRDLVQRRVVEAYAAELENSKREGWVEQRFDDLDYHLLDGAQQAHID
jgi:stage V sporulation protein G